MTLIPLSHRVAASFALALAASCTASGNTCLIRSGNYSSDVVADDSVGTHQRSSAVGHSDRHQQGPTVEASACVTISKRHLSFEAGLSDGAGPVGARDMPYQCDKSGAITFTFIDERGNKGAGKINRIRKSVHLSLEPIVPNKHELSSEQILRNYGDYVLSTVPSSCTISRK